MIKQNRVIRRLIITVLSIVLIMGNVSITKAAVKEPIEISPYYVNISNMSAHFDISGIKATCNASLKTSKSTSLKIKMECQKKTSNGYETVKTWTGSKSGTYLVITESRNINILCDYRLKVTFNAGTETEVIYRY